MLLKVLAYVVCVSTAWNMSASIGVAIPIIGKRQVAFKRNGRSTVSGEKAIHGGYEGV